MFQAAIAAVLLLGIYKLVARKPTEEGEYYIRVEWWLAFAFVLAPAILIYFISIGLAALQVPPGIIFATYILYFVIPFITLKVMLEFETKEAMKLALFVPIVVIVSEIPFLVLVNT